MSIIHVEKWGSHIKQCMSEKAQKINFQCPFLPFIHTQTHT
jgi:hypothetical protein